MPKVTTFGVSVVASHRAERMIATWVADGSDGQVFWFLPGVDGRRKPKGFAPTSAPGDFRILWVAVFRLGMLAIPWIGPLVGAGWLASTAVGALAGSAIGAVADLGIDEADVPVYSEAVRRGAILVTARFPEEHRHAVEQALGQGPDIHQRPRDYEASGWRADDAAGSGTTGINRPLL